MKYKANNGMRRSKSFRVSIPNDFLSAVRSEVYKNKAIKEFGNQVVERLEKEYPGRIWDQEGINYLKRLLK